jgi:PhnB protein
MAATPIPEGYHTVTPFLSLDDAAGAIEFYKRAFGAEERGRMPAPDGRIAHAEIQIGDSVIMLSDMFEGQSLGKTPKQAGGTTVGLFLYVEDVDEVFKQALDAGATATSEPEDMFWGDRFGRVTDPFGHDWQIATRKEDLTPEELEKRSQEAAASLG